MMKPSEPFVVPYLAGPDKNISLGVVSLLTCLSQIYVLLEPMSKPWVGAKYQHFLQSQR